MESYGNCTVCGKRFGTDGFKFYEPCEHIKAQDKRIREKRLSDEVKDREKPKSLPGNQVDVKREG